MSNWYIIPKEDDLMHFGILGMKWGVRRFQNPDGTLTAAGQARYKKQLESIYSSKAGSYKSRRYQGGRLTATKRDLKLQKLTDKEKKYIRNKLLKKEYDEYMNVLKKNRYNEEDDKLTFLKKELETYKAELKYAKKASKLVDKILGDVGNESLDTSDKMNKAKTIKEDTKHRLKLDFSTALLPGAIKKVEERIKEEESKINKGG